MKYSREYILRRAFDVFMQKGYDSASISVLQKELCMSRGAMYRYFDNKEDLFRAVIDEYFFKLFERYLYKMDKQHAYTIEEFIEITYRRQKLIVNIFVKAGVTHLVFLNYTALMIQAVKYYPEFIVRFNDINKLLISHWQQALRNSIKQKEIRSDIDIDIMSILFNNVCIKESSSHDWEIDDKDIFSINILQDINRRKQVIDYLYSLIKI